MTHAFLSFTGFCALLLAPSVHAVDANYVKLVHVETGKVLGIADDADESGARAILVKDEKNEARQWKLEKDGDHWKLINRKSSKVLDVFEESTEEGTPIIIWDDKAEGNDNQRWTWIGEGKDRRLKSKSSELVLDIDDEGKVVQRKSDDGVKTQLWRVVEITE